MGTAGVGQRLGLSVVLALAACSDAVGADPGDGGMPGTDDSGGASEGDDDGDDSAPDPDDGAVDDGDASGTSAAGDDGGSDGPAPDASAWCLYKVVADAASTALNVHAEPDPASAVQYTLAVGNTVWGGPTVTAGYRDLNQNLDLPQWAEAARLMNTGMCEDVEDPPPPPMEEPVDLPQGFQLPFDCGQTWRLDTWGHAPALDMVRDPSQVGTEGANLRAPADGLVNQSYYHENAGNMVQIDHGGGLFTTYIHMQSRAVEQGDTVVRGDLIGAVGATGPTSNGHPHLHFELGQDADGDGSATWGFAGAERINPWFDGIEYGQENALTWFNVASNNCP